MINLSGSNPKRQIFRAREGSVAIWIAVMLPGIIMAAAMAIEVGGWGAAQISMQRSADSAASAGITYLMSQATPGAASALQSTVVYASRIAQLNQVLGGGGTPTAVAVCSGTSGCGTGASVTGYTVTNGNIVASIDTSTIPSTLSLQVSRQVPAVISTLFDSRTSYTISAASSARWIPAFNSGGSVGGNNGSGQPCILALAGDNGITTGTDIDDVGTGTIYAPNCTIRSNGGMVDKGSNTITAKAIYTSGSFSKTGSGTVSAPIYQNQRQIPDPYANNATLQPALSNANTAAAAAAINCTGTQPTCTGPVGATVCASTMCTINPGTYAGFSTNGSGTFTLNPGLYTFTGGISLGGSTTVTGTDVTILMGAGSASSPSILYVGGSVSLSLSAPATTTVSTWAGSAATRPIPGIMFASLSTGSSKYSGSNDSPNIGVFYYPNGPVTVSGSGSTGSPGCAEVIAYSISLNGTPSFDSSTCVSTYGAIGFNSTPSSAMAQLVQ